jgi:hypothetical protein
MHLHNFRWKLQFVWSIRTRIKGLLISEYQMMWLYYPIVSVASSTLYVFDPLEYYNIRERCDGGEFPARENGIQYNNILKIKINRKTQNLLKKRKAHGWLVLSLSLSFRVYVCLLCNSLHTHKKCEGSSSARREKGTLKTCFAYTYTVFNSSMLFHRCLFYITI